MEYAILPNRFISVTSTDDQKTQLIRRRPTLSAEYIVASVKRHKLATFTALALVTFLGVGLSVYRYNAAPANTMHGAIDAETTEKDLKISRVAASGNVFDIAISPDGRFVAYSTGDPDWQSLHVKELASQRDTEIVPASAVEKHWFIRLVFTPDSLNLIYEYNTAKNEDMFRVPIVGGTPVKIAESTRSLSISPDGRFMALFKNLYENGNDWKGTELVVSKVDGSDERILKHTLEGKDEIIDCAVPAWSPDSKWLACAMQHDDFDQMYAINVADGTTRRMSNQKWAIPVNGVVWMPDNTLVIAGKEKANEPSQLWRVSESEAKQITVDAVGYTQLSATRDGKTLVTIQAKYRSDLWVSPGNDPSHAIQVTSSGEMRNFFPLPNRNVVFTSEITDPPQLWLLNRDGKDRRQLTFDESAIGGPIVTPDGKFIIYGSGPRRDDGFHIHRMNVDGSDQRELTSTPGKAIKISQDSKWIYYYSPKRENGTDSLYKMSIDGGSPSVVARAKLEWPLDISSRDDRIAALVYNSAYVPTGINVFDKSGKLLNTIPVPPSVFSGGPSLKWTPDGRRIAFVDVSNGARNIWTVSADGKGRPRPFTNFTSPGVVTFKWSYDGKELFIMRRDSTSDAMMITNAKQ